VTDDRADGGATGLPFLPFWILMAYARDLAPGAVDWEAAPVLDLAALEGLLADGAAHRYQPFRIPRAQLLALEEPPAEPNPARIERTTAGWIEDAGWDRPVRFFTPGAPPAAEPGDLVRADGFFFKHLAHGSDPKESGARVSPVFVLARVERVLAPRRGLFTALGLGVLASSAALLLLFAKLLLAPGGSRSASLLERLGWRRRARRLRGAPARPGEP
jgi:hypothetical protein